MYRTVISCDSAICVRVRHDSVDDDSCDSCVLIVVFKLCRYPESHDFSDTCVLAVQVFGISRDCSDSCVQAVQVSGITTALIVVSLCRYPESRLFWYLCFGCAGILNHAWRSCSTVVSPSYWTPWSSTTSSTGTGVCFATSSTSCAIPGSSYPKTSPTWTYS